MQAAIPIVAVELVPLSAYDVLSKAMPTTRIVSGPNLWPFRSGGSAWRASGADRWKSLCVARTYRPYSSRHSILPCSI